MNFCNICIVSVLLLLVLSFSFMDMLFFMLYFSLWQMLSETEVFVGFTDGASWHTQSLASTAWVIFTPQGQLLSSGGICLGDSTNNVTEYNTVLELLHDALLHGISHLWFYLDTQLVLSQLNGVYCVYDPTLH